MSNHIPGAILVVDDDSSNVSLCIDLLSEMGLTKNVLSAPNGEIALKIISKRKVSLIITDWQMPIMNGLELVQNVKSNEQTKEIFIIMLTAVMVESNQLKEAFDAGVNDFLRKPFDSLEFFGRVKNTLNLIAAQNSLKEKNKVISNQNQQLQELDLAKKRFFINIVHDLKLPLTLIKAQSDILIDDFEVYLPKHAEKKLEIINHSSKKVEQLINEITELIKLENSQLNIERNLVNLSSLLKETIQLLQPFAEKKHINLTSEEDQQFEYFNYIDAKRIEKVVVNLISNAIKFTPENGSVSIHLTKKADSFHIRINDTGLGISKEDIPNIFNRFFQANVKNYKERHGLGIGLALSKEIIDAHSGKIMVDSNQSGTTMLIEIPHMNPPKGITSIDFKSNVENHPLLLDQGNSSIPQSMDIKLPTGNCDGSKPTILLVEDVLEIQELIIEILQDDYCIIPANHGIAALKILELNQIDLIVTDIVMPLMDGFQLLKSIKEKGKFASIPVLIVSSRFTEENEMEALGFGVNNFIKKPFNTKELKLRIKNLLTSNISKNTIPELFDKYDMDKINQVIIKKLELLVISKLDDSRLTVSMLANEIAFSERKLFRFLKNLLDITPLEFIKQIRFQLVKQSLKLGKFNSMSEAAKSIGLKNVSEFKLQYKVRFGEEPEL